MVTTIVCSDVEYKEGRTAAELLVPIPGMMVCQSRQIILYNCNEGSRYKDVVIGSMSRLHEINITF